MSTQYMSFPQMVLQQVPALNNTLVDGQTSFLSGNLYNALHVSLVGGSSGFTPDVISVENSDIAFPQRSLNAAAYCIGYDVAGVALHIVNVRGLDTLEAGVAVATVEKGMNTVSHNMVLDYAANTFYPNAQLPDNADVQAVASNGFAGVIARLQAFNGTTYDRLRTASAANISATTQSQALLTSLQGDWSINHAPAANTTATITRAAGAAGVRHVCTSIHAKMIDVAAAGLGPLTVTLRDGATGAGTILWQTKLFASLTAAIGKDEITLTGLNIVGSAATAMTLEFTAGPGASNFELVDLAGHSV